MSRDMMNFNIHEGALEAIVHGYKNGFIRPDEYNNLTQCDSLADLKSQLQVTDFGNFLQNEGHLTPRVITQKAMERLVSEFHDLRENCEAPLSRFLDFLTYEHMIGNVLKLINGTRHGRDTSELLAKCHPLGIFQGMAALTTATSIDDMFETVLIDSPIGRFFQRTNQKDFDEQSMEYIRGILLKNYLEQFYDFCLELGGETATIMTEILDFEADRTVITLTLNTCRVKDLLPEDRRKLYPNIGKLVQDHDVLCEVEDEERLKERLKSYPEYYELLDDARSGLDGGAKSLERRFQEMAVDMYRNAMMRQFQYGVFYGWVKLREVEVNNLMWISECIVQGMKSRINEYSQIC